MKSSLPIIIGVVALVVGVGYFATQDKGARQDSVASTNTETRKQDTALPTANESKAVSPEATDTAVASASAYLPYSANAIATSNADRILLFFHATWCPSCKALDADIVKNAGTIPDGVTIYKVDYDTSTELKRKYGVTTQHSIIEINKSGEALSTITHPLTLTAVIATLQ